MKCTNMKYIVNCDTTSGVPNGGIRVQTTTFSKYNSWDLSENIFKYCKNGFSETYKGLGLPLDTITLTPMVNLYLISNLDALFLRWCGVIVVLLMGLAGFKHTRNTPMDFTNWALLHYETPRWKSISGFLQYLALF